MSRMTGLPHLDLTPKDVSDESRAEIFAALQRLTSLTSIRLRDWALNCIRHSALLHSPA